jgi:hypothetical protein
MARLITYLGVELELDEIAGLGHNVLRIEEQSAVGSADLDNVSVNVLPCCGRRVCCGRR